MQPPIKDLIQEWLFSQNDLYAVQYINADNGWVFCTSLVHLIVSNEYMQLPFLSSIDKAKNLARKSVQDYPVPHRVIKICRTYVNDKFIVYEIVGICIPPK